MNNFIGGFCITFNLGALILSIIMESWYLIPFNLLGIGIGVMICLEAK